MERPKQYEVHSVEQMKALSHKLRIAILNVLGDQKPRTNKQIAEILGLAPTRIHYHIRELEKVGLLEQVETRHIGGIVEKYYLAVAVNIYVVSEQKSMVVKALAAEYLDVYMKQDFDETETTEHINILNFTAQEKAEFDSELKAFYQKWAEKCSGEREPETEQWRFLALLFPDRPKENGSC